MNDDRNLPRLPGGATLTHDCPNCGQQLIELDLWDFFDGGGTPEMFATMLETLSNAHRPDCKPKRAKVSRTNRRRRLAWWAGTLSFTVVWFALGVMAIMGRFPATPLSVGLVYIMAAVVVGVQAVGHLSAFRAGYMRGRATAAQPRVVWRNLHPADRWVTEPEKAETADEAGES